MMAGWGCKPFPLSSSATCPGTSHAAVCLRVQFRLRRGEAGTWTRVGSTTSTVHRNFPGRRLFPPVPSVSRQTVDDSAESMLICSRLSPRNARSGADTSTSTRASQTRLVTRAFSIARCRILDVTHVLWSPRNGNAVRALAGLTFRPCNTRILSYPPPLLGRCKRSMTTGQHSACEATGGLLSSFSW